MCMSDGVGVDVSGGVIEGEGEKGRSRDRMRRRGISWEEKKKVIGKVRGRERRRGRRRRGIR